MSNHNINNMDDMSDSEVDRQLRMGLDYLKLYLNVCKWRDIAKEKGINLNSEYSSDEIASTMDALMDEAEYLEPLVRGFINDKGEGDSHE